MKTKTLRALAILSIIAASSASAGPFGFTVVNSGPIDPANGWIYNASGTFSVDGEDNKGTPTHSRLNSPLINVNTVDPLSLSFDHRYSIEAGNWDGGAVFISVNGGAYTQVGSAQFAQNGYSAGPLIGNHDLKNQFAFGGDSPGYSTPSFITSIATLGSFGIGDTLSIQFLAAFDEFAKGTEPNWEIDALSVTTAQGTVVYSESFDTVPEPATLALFGLGLAGLGLQRRRRAA